MFWVVLTFVLEIRFRAYRYSEGVGTPEQSERASTMLVRASFLLVNIHRYITVQP